MAQAALIFLFGALFGWIIQYAELNKFDTISGQSDATDNRVVKTILLAIGLGAILLALLTGAGLAGFHIKPFIAGGLIIGGLIFGSGMAILGYCPGTLAVSAGEGAIDALIGIAGGLSGGWLFSIAFPFIKPWLGPNEGKLSLFGLFGNYSAGYYIITIIIGLLLIFLAFKIKSKKGTQTGKWIMAGILLAVLEAIVFLHQTTGRPIGASTSYPYLADVITGTTSGTYFQKIAKPGHWEVIFLTGALLAALIASLAKKKFSFTLIHPRWAEYKGNDASKRIFWAFTGGFLLIFGARMAGGCTSGHILSGGMQLAFGSLFFAVFVFIGLIVTGRIFYNRKAFKK